ncbi:hypothetical protein ACIOHS_39620 [Streptomyces sp. NPDC088253]|uniref:hypothetical protein n=1 Tax=Streptomyces sp. NPDC088253 TaxID=3365846 RepID=UPI00382A175C
MQRSTPGLPRTVLALDSVDEIPPALGRLGEGGERDLRTRVLGYVRMRGVWLRAMLAE